MPTLLDVQHVIHKLLIVPVALCQINLIGIDDQQRRGIVVKKELAVHLVKLLQILTIDQSLGINTAAIPSETWFCNKTFLWN